MCVGIQVDPAWGDKGNYTGRCRYGQPLGPMQAAIRYMDRRRAVGQARELGLAERFGIRLETELNTIAGLPMVTGRNRLKRYAQSETRAARESGDSSKSSWLKRAAVNCATWGAYGAEATFLWEVVVNRKLPPKEIAKNAAMACAGAVVAPPLDRWIKNKGYDL
jgi:hypothetical protein